MPLGLAAVGALFQTLPTPAKFSPLPSPRTELASPLSQPHRPTLGSTHALVRHFYFLWLSHCPSFDESSLASSFSIGRPSTQPRARDATAATTMPDDALAAATAAAATTTLPGCSQHAAPVTGEFFSPPPFFHSLYRCVADPLDLQSLPLSTLHNDEQSFSMAYIPPTMARLHSRRRRRRRRPTTAILRRPTMTMALDEDGDGARL